MSSNRQSQNDSVLFSNVSIFESDGWKGRERERERVSHKNTQANDKLERWMATELVKSGRRSEGEWGASFGNYHIII